MSSPEEFSSQDELGDLTDLSQQSQYHHQELGDIIRRVSVTDLRSHSQLSMRRLTRTPSNSSVYSQPDNDVLYDIVRAQWKKLKHKSKKPQQSSTLTINLPTCTEPCPRSEALLELLRVREEDLFLAAELGLALLSKFEQSQTTMRDLIQEHENTLLQVDLLSQTINDDKVEADEFANEKQGLVERIGDIIDQLTQSESKIQELSNLVQQREEELEKSQHQIAKLTKLKQENESLYSKIDSLQSELALLESQEDSHKGKWKRALARVSELEELYAKSKSEVLALKEMNEKFEERRIPVFSKGGMSSPTAPQLNELFNLVKELTASNVASNAQNLQLRADLSNVTELLNDCRNEFLQYKASVEETMSQTDAIPVNEGEDMKGKSVLEELESYVLENSLKKLKSRSPVLNAEISKLDIHGIADLEPPILDDISEPMSVSGTSDPEQSLSVTSSSQSANPNTATLKKKKKSTVSSPKTPNKRHFSNTSASLSTLPSSTGIYLRMLTSMSDDLFHRLSKTDTVQLNRLLRRTFDLSELTGLSNSLIENVVVDVGNMVKRFPKPKPENKEGNVDDTAAIVYPVVESIQSLLSEIGKLRIELNDLSLSYFDHLDELSKRDLNKTLEKIATNAPEQKQESQGVLFRKSRSISDLKNVEKEVIGDKDDDTESNYERNISPSRAQPNILSSVWKIFGKKDGLENQEETTDAITPRGDGEDPWTFIRKNLTVRPQKNANSAENRGRDEEPSSPKPITRSKSQGATVEKTGKSPQKTGLADLILSAAAGRVGQRVLYEDERLMRDNLEPWIPRSKA
ncbi:hypothetical protein HK098_005038 [Nowakowskiella sp. JEL0407]|nr:hypothetical protein HK098_005038 [Nowakowskiella sp. JEL0407]